MRKINQWANIVRWLGPIFFGSSSFVLGGVYMRFHVSRQVFCMKTAHFHHVLDRFWAVVREFRQPTPFLRSREFLWQAGSLIFPFSRNMLVYAMRYI